MKNKIWYGALVGLLLTAPLIAVLYLAEQIAGLPFLPFDLFDGLARVLPGDLITFGIDTMVDALIALDLGRLDNAAKTSERIMAILQFTGIGVIAGALYFALADRWAGAQKVLDRFLATGLVLGLAFGIPMLILSNDINTSATAAPAVSALWILVVFLGWGVAHGLAYKQLAAFSSSATTITSETPSEFAPAAARLAANFDAVDRRTFLVQMGGLTATLTVIGAGLGELVKTFEGEEIVGGDVDISNVRNETMLVEVAPGTRPEYTPLEDHYRIDINSGRPPQIDEATWLLMIGGLVNNPVELTLADIRTNYVSQNQFITMSCISNRVAGDLISTTQWTGVSMQQILDTVQPKPEATHIRITSADGFDEVIALDLIREDDRVMLTYAFDDVPLPQKHGFPLRIYIPDRFGMKQPKWITNMEFIDSWEEGYWVRRGWSKDAIARATAVIDTVAVEASFEQNGATFIPVGGIAWAGARGISRVEVKVDGEDWQPAQLRAPLSETTWTLWRYDWAFEEGDHTFAVRCVEGDGTTRQIESRADVRPDGATGIHTKQADV